MDRQKNYFGLGIIRGKFVAIVMLFFIIGATGIGSFIISETRVNNDKLSIYSLVNSNMPLELESAYGDMEACHPKVLYFKQPWNGYKYWISFSPYPKADDSKENPHILASNDLQKWVEPEGFYNPLDEIGGTFKKGIIYNSDPELVYNSDTEELECWWRYVNDDKNQMILYRRCTKDGRTWTEKELMVETARSELDYVSPAIIYEDKVYRMWSVGGGYRVQYTESLDGCLWKPVQYLDIQYENRNLKTWHLSVIGTSDETYKMIISAFDNSIEKGARTEMSLYYSSSLDNKKWDMARKILSPESSSSAWDNKGLYRSCLLYNMDGTYSLFYSGINEDGTRGVGLIKNILIK